MKAVIVLLFAALIVAGKSYSKNAPPIKNIKSNIALAKIHPQDTVIPPENIRIVFEKKYPAATHIVWYKYVPGTMKPAPGSWNYNMGADDYYVSFYWDDADYIAWYDNGAWIRSSKTIEHAELPAAVRNAVTTQYPGYVITDVDLESDNKQMLYEVDLEKGDKKWEIHFTEAGAIVKKKVKDLTKADVEQAMVDDFETRFPNATQVVWYKYVPDERSDILPSDWDYGMDENDYEVRFVSAGDTYSAWYDNGAWVRSETRTFDMSKLPSSVNDAIKTQYAGYTIREADREENKNNQVLYEVELEKGNEKCKIHYTADGNIMKKKCRMGGAKTKTIGS